MKKDLVSQEARMELFYELDKTKVELDVALESFNSAPMDLVDYYSYRIKAAEAKYDYLLKQMKDMNLSKF